MSIPNFNTKNVAEIPHNLGAKRLGCHDPKNPRPSQTEEDKTRGKKKLNTHRKKNTRKNYCSYHQTKHETTRLKPSRGTREKRTPEMPRKIREKKLSELLEDDESWRQIQWQTQGILLSRFQAKAPPMLKWGVFLVWEHSPKRTGHPVQTSRDPLMRHLGIRKIHPVFYLASFGDIFFKKNMAFRGDVSLQKMKMPKTQLSSCLRHPTRRKLLKIWRKKSTLLRVWEWFDCIKTTACSISKAHFVGELLNKWMKFEELKTKQLCETSSENDKKRRTHFETSSKVRSYCCCYCHHWYSVCFN